MRYFEGSPFITHSTDYRLRGFEAYFKCISRTSRDSKLANSLMVWTDDSAISDDLSTHS
jgi:hypothetical protein